jgi:formate--tetrahydrofolate ligase
MSSEIEAAKSNIKPICEIAKKLSIPSDDLELYGKYKAKLPLKLINEDIYKKSDLILVTAVSPTPAGEGKTTITIGLVDGLNKIGKKTIGVLREPSLGPVFGMKGGATGGGLNQVIPMEDINLHFTGDFSAIEKANNLLAALIDNNLQSKTNNLQIDPRTVLFKRVIDMNDRALRHIVLGLGGVSGGVVRESGFNITAASEVMAILCLSENFSDLKERLGNIFVGYTFEGNPVFAKDLKAEGAMAVLLKDAILPNLVQTLENNPVIIHGGPFANIAQGTNSIIATKMGLSLADIAVTEAGFGADLGAEKFFDIKCATAGFKPKLAVLVASIKALKFHGGQNIANIQELNLHALKLGFKNLERHKENLQKFGVDVLVAINSFSSDKEDETKLLISLLEEKKIQFSLSEGFKKGSKGCIELAEMVCQLLETNKQSHFKPL